MIVIIYYQQRCFKIVSDYKKQTILPKYRNKALTRYQYKWIKKRRNLRDIGRWRMYVARKIKGQHIGKMNVLHSRCFIKKNRGLVVRKDEIFFEREMLFAVGITIMRQLFGKLCFKQQVANWRTGKSWNSSTRKQISVIMFLSFTTVAIIRMIVLTLPVAGKFNRMPAYAL